MHTPIDRWAAHMAFRGSARTTITTRTRALRRVERACGGDLLTLGPSDIVAYLAQYDRASTRATILSYIRCFYDFALDEGLVAESPAARLPTIKVPTAVPRPAPVTEVAEVLRRATPRTRSFVLLMAYAGLRCFEVAAFRPEHLAVDGAGRWWLSIPRGKGGHQQSVPIAAWVAQELRDGPTWDVTVQTVQKDVRQALRDIGSPTTPHQLRHYYGTTALHTTDNLRVVQQMMRHASPATTARYTLVTSSETSNAAEGLPRIA